jgi:hypothetical protein
MSFHRYRSPSSRLEDLSEECASRRVQRRDAFLRRELRMLGTAAETISSAYRSSEVRLGLQWQIRDVVQVPLREIRAQKAQVLILDHLACQLSCHAVKSRTSAESAVNKQIDRRYDANTYAHRTSPPFQGRRSRGGERSTEAGRGPGATCPGRESRRCDARREIERTS